MSGPFDAAARAVAPLDEAAMADADALQARLTKPAGSGIGLALSRQIAEAHGGTLALENRTDTKGCRAILRLPS